MRTLLIATLLLVLATPLASAEGGTSDASTGTSSTESGSTLSAEQPMVTPVGPPDPGSGCKPNCM